MTESSALRVLRIQGELRRRAAVEFATRPAPLAVIVHLSDQLDDEIFRPKKAEAVALELGIPDSTAADALRLLVERSYLEEGLRINRVKSYRLAKPRNGNTSAVLETSDTKSRVQQSPNQTQANSR